MAGGRCVIDTRPEAVCVDRPGDTLLDRITPGAPANGRYTVYIIGKGEIKTGTRLTLAVGGETVELTEADTGDFATHLTLAVPAGNKLEITFISTNTGASPSFVETAGWLVTFTPD